jgi:hypothetical protein
VALLGADRAEIEGTDDHLTLSMTIGAQTAAFGANLGRLEFLYGLHDIFSLSDFSSSGDADNHVRMRFGRPGLGFLTSANGLDQSFMIFRTSAPVGRLVLDSFDDLTQGSSLIDVSLYCVSFDSTACAPLPDGFGTPNTGCGDLIICDFAATVPDADPLPEPDARWLILPALILLPFQRRLRDRRRGYRSQVSPMASL